MGNGKGRDQNREWLWPEVTKSSPVHSSEYCYCYSSGGWVQEMSPEGAVEQVHCIQLYQVPAHTSRSGGAENLWENMLHITRRKKDCSIEHYTTSQVTCSHVKKRLQNHASSASL